MITNGKDLGIKRFSIKYNNADSDEISQYYKKNISPIYFKPLVYNGKISNEHHQLSVDGCQMWSCDCVSGMNLSYKNVFNPDSYVIYFTKRGEMRIDMGKRSFNSSKDSYFVGKLDHFDRIKMGPGRAHVAVSFTHKAISSQLSEMIDDAVFTDIGFEELTTIDSIKTLQLARAIEFAEPYLHNDRSIISTLFYMQLFKALTCLLVETVPNNFSDRIGRRVSPALPRHLKKAIDYMHAHAGEQITIGDIATAAGISVRALQVAFQQFRDTTPLNYLRTLRLNIARDKLKKSEYSTVADAARASGFTHLGRFSVTYQRAFGEHPHDTLNKILIPR